MKLATLLLVGYNLFVWGTLFAASHGRFTTRQGHRRIHQPTRLPRPHMPRQARVGRVG